MQSSMHRIMNLKQLRAVNQTQGWFWKKKKKNVCPSIFNAVHYIDSQFRVGGYAEHSQSKDRKMDKGRWEQRKCKQTKGWKQTQKKKKKH